MRYTMLEDIINGCSIQPGDKRRLKAHDGNYRIMTCVKRYPHHVSFVYGNGNRMSFTYKTLMGFGTGGI